MKKTFISPTVEQIRIKSESVAETENVPTTSVGLEDFSDTDWQ